MCSFIFFPRLIPRHEALKINMFGKGKVNGFTLGKERTASVAGFNSLECLGNMHNDVSRMRQDEPVSVSIHINDNFKQRFQDAVQILEKRLKVLWMYLRFLPMTGQSELKPIECNFEQLKKLQNNTRSGEKNESIFQNILAVFPLDLDTTNMHQSHQYFTSPTGLPDCSLMKKEKIANSILPELDKTTEAMLWFMAETQKRGRLMCKTYELNIPGTIPKGMEDFSPWDIAPKGKGPHCLPPLGTPPVPTGPYIGKPSYVPPLPSCPRRDKKKSKKGPRKCC